MRRGVGGAVAAVLAGLLGGVAGAPAAFGTTDDDGAPAAEVLITSITPRVLGPGEDLRIRGTLRNTGPTAITEPRVAVHLGNTQFISRFSLDLWRSAGDQEALGPTVHTVDLAAPLAPGASVPVDLLVPAGAIGLPTRLTSWGARGLAIQVTDRSAPAAGRLSVTRTFALWFPDQQVTATRVSILVPIAGPAIDPAGSWTTALDEATRPGGRLAAVLAATGGHTEVTWVVDPWLIDAAPQAGGAAPGWADGLLEAMTDREVHLLPYADPDLAALAHAGAGELLVTATRRAHDVARSSGLPDGARVQLAWPADPLPDQATAGLANSDRTRALVVGPGELLPPAVLTYTPTGRTQVAVGGGEVTVLVPDERLSGALVTGQVLAAGSGSPVTGAVAAQDLLAELAVITRERPADGRHLLLTVPRDWSPDPAVVDAQLGAILDAPWVRAEPVSALIGAADPEIDRGTLPSREVARTEVSPGELDQARTAVSLREQLATILADPEGELGDLELELLAPASVAWRADPVGRAAAVSESRSATERLRAGVSVQPGPAVNLVSTSGDMPVDVVNDLDQEVTLQVALVPGDRRLVADEAVPVTIPPRSLATVVIPVHAVQSADVDVRVELRTPDGVVIDDSSHFTVRVRAEWEGIGTAVIGGLLAIVLAIGLIRTIRRGRAGSRTAPQARSGPDTLSPEEDAERERADDSDGAPGPDPGEGDEPSSPDAPPDETEARHT